MKRSENGMVTPFEKIAWNNDKSKLSIKLPPKAIENPLLLYIEFEENSERFYLGEEKAVWQIAENSNLISKYKGSLLMLSEGRPLGSLLMDSYDFTTNCLQGVTNIFRPMLHSIDSGNSEKASDYKMLDKLWNEGNTFQRIIINYLFCRFYQVKHLAANGTAGIFAYTAERRGEMYSDLEQSMEQEFDLLAHNPNTLSDLKQLRYYNGNSIYFLADKSTESKIPGSREALNIMLFLLVRPLFALFSSESAVFLKTFIFKGELSFLALAESSRKITSRHQ